MSNNLFQYIMSYMRSFNVYIMLTAGEERFRTLELKGTFLKTDLSYLALP